MTDGAEVIQIRQRVEFTTLRGDTLAVDVEKIRQGHTASQTVVGSFFLTDDAWAHAVDTGCFHLDTVSESPARDTDQPIELRARLRPGVAETVFDGEADLEQRLSDPVDPLRHTESWFATGILQQVDLPMEFDGVVGPDAAANVGVHTVWNEFLDETEADSVLETITAFFDDESAYESPEANLVQAEIPIGDDHQLSLYIYADEERRECQIYTVYPAQIPEAARPAVSQVLATRNFELERGSFGLNPADGTVRFRLHVYVDEEPVVEAINTALSAMRSVAETLRELAATD